MPWPLYNPRFTLPPGSSQLARGFATAATRSIRVQQVRTDIANSAVQGLVGSKWSSAGELPALFQAQVRADARGFAARQAEVYGPIWRELDSILAPLSVQDTGRLVLSSDASPSSGGHISLSISREPPAPEGAPLGDYRTLRSLMGGFPGYFAQLDQATQTSYIHALQANGPAAAAAALSGAWKGLGDFNASQFLNRVPLSGVFAIGMSSMITIAGHSVLDVPDGRMHTILNSTLPDHALQGSVALSLLERPSGRYLITVHVGQSPILGVNAVGTLVASRSFKLSMIRGMYALDNQEAMGARCGQREAARLYLSDFVASTFQCETLRAGGVSLIIDTALLVAADAIAGPLMATLHRFNPSSPIYIEPAAMQAKSDDELVSESVRQAVSLGERPSGSGWGSPSGGGGGGSGSHSDPPVDPSHPDQHPDEHPDRHPDEHRSDPVEGRP